jgi:unsaturated rhamnogalacturonyl hydrolase
MFAYAFAKGVRRHLLPADFLAPAVRAFRGLLEHQVRLNADGTASLEGTCAVAGLGGHPYRDGSYNYYVGERPLTDDPKGVGSFILAALEMEAAGIVGLSSE